MYPRVSGRLGNPIDLNVTFYRSGIATDPYAIRKVQIYRSAVEDENLIAEFPIVDPGDPTYPLPASRENDSAGTPKPGVYHLYWDVPKTGIPTPDTFFDVWSYLPDVCIDESGGTTGGDCIDDETQWQQCCNQFWLYPDSFYCDSGLENIRLGFEAMDIKLHQPEYRTIEVGMMPLPLYDYDYNKMAPIIPMLTGYFSLYTENCELLIDREPMRIGIRQGTYRTNPFTLQYTFDTRRVLKGSYKYQVSVCLPNGESRASPKFQLQVS
jgi:hypothetical protein